MPSPTPAPTVHRVYRDHEGVVHVVVTVPDDAKSARLVAQDALTEALGFLVPYARLTGMWVEDDVVLAEYRRWLG